MTGGLSDLIKQGLEKHAKEDAAFSAKYKSAKLEDCVSAIYTALESIARDAVKGSGGAAACGSDDLLVSAAIHWYDEDAPTTDSIKEILKGGVEVIKQNKPSAPSKTKAEKPKAKPAAKKTPAKMGIVKPAAKPLPKPVPAPVEADEDDDDFEI